MNPAGRGTGALVVGLLAFAAAAQEPAPAPPPVTPADVSAVEALDKLGQEMGKAICLPSRFDDVRIRAIGAASVNASDRLEHVRSMLAEEGWALLTAGTGTPSGMWRVVHEDEAARKPGRVLDAAAIRRDPSLLSRPAEWVTVVYRLVSAKAEAVVPAVEVLLDTRHGATMRGVPGAEAVVVCEKAANAQRLIEAIALMDAGPVVTSPTLRVVILKGVAADSAAKVLEARQGFEPRDSAAAGVRVIALAGSAPALALVGPEAGIAKCVEWLATLDPTVVGGRK